MDLNCFKKLKPNLGAGIGAFYTKMASMINRIQTESLSHLESSEWKRLRTVRKRTKSQCNKAYNFIAQLEHNNEEFIPTMTDYITRMNEDDTWSETKANHQNLMNALEEFKAKHKADEYCIKKVESALRNAEKNMDESLRRSDRLKDIRAAKKALG
jgi:hypothetical protein